MRKILSALVLILGLAVVPAAHATPITYNLTLTSFGGFFGGNVAGGTGYITLDDTPGSGSDFFSKPGFPGQQITDLSFNIGPDVFKLADAVTLTTATFFNGALTSLTYNGVLPDGKFDITFNAYPSLWTGLTYSFNDDPKDLDSYGTISANVATAHAPEPSTLMLLGSGALGLAGFARRKFAA